VNTLATTRFPLRTFSENVNELDWTLAVETTTIKATRKGEAQRHRTPPSANRNRPDYTPLIGPCQEALRYRQGVPSPNKCAGHESI
jgi:hypothetical protein